MYKNLILNLINATPKSAWRAVTLVESGIVKYIDSHCNCDQK